MNESNMYIKEKRKDFLTKGFILLILMIASLVCAFAPFLINSISDGKTAFFVIGGVLFAIFSSIFGYLLYKEFKPEVMLILSKRGFVDKKNVGTTIEIEWTNVSSVKLLGNQDMPFLGITLENPDIVMARMKKREKSEMQSNIDESLPHILIEQSEIYTPVNELKDTFVRFIRESRAVSSEEPPQQKTKNNPFTTDDVLRAFGKLPPQEDAVDDAIDIEYEENLNNDLTKTRVVPQEENIITDTIVVDAAQTEEFVRVSNDEQTTNIEQPIDNEQILDETSSNTPEPTAIPPITVVNEEVSENKNIENVESSSEIESTNSTYDDFTAEINEFLSHAKFSKITEIGKLLNESDLPYSASRDQKQANDLVSDKNEKQSSEAANESSIQYNHPENDDIDDALSFVNTPTDNSSDINYNKDFNIILPDELFADDNEPERSFDVTFESLIEQSKELDQNNDEVQFKGFDSMGDTKIF